MNSTMPVARLPLKRSFVGLLAVASGVNLVWAGAMMLRIVIDLPARDRIGPVAFAELSRATDLSTGLVFYPLMGVASALLACVAWLVATRAQAPRTMRAQTAVAAASTLLVLAVTALAAPIMFRIGGSPNDPALLEPLADRFTVLTNIRAALGTVGAVALLSALTTCALRAVQDE